MTDQHAVCRVSFECGHIAHIFGEEYGDGSAWCQTCGKFQVYDRCAVCRSLDCEHPRRDPDASCDDEDDDLGCLMLSPGRGNPGQPRSSSASTCFRGGWVVDSAVRRLISAVQSLPLRDDTQEAETLAAIVRSAPRFETEHHRLCSSRGFPPENGGECDCYLRAWQPALDALAALVALCDSHGAAYLHTYAAEAAAELQRAETEPGYADQSSRTDAAAGSPPTAVEGEVVPAYLHTYAAEGAAELEAVRARVAHLEDLLARSDPHRENYELATLTITQQAERLATAEAELAAAREAHDLALDDLRMQVVAAEQETREAEAELADYREALEQIDTYADNEPFDPKRAYFADVRKIARDALARYRVTKETQT